MGKRILLSSIVVMTAAGISLGDTSASRMFRNEGHGGRAGYLAPDDDVRRVTALHDVVTPHITWAPRSTGDALRVLAIADAMCGRWPVELSQRFNFEVNTVYCQSPSAVGAPVKQTHFGLRAPDIEARLLQALNEPLDVIISSMKPEVLGKRVSARLAGRIQTGVGYVGPTAGLDLGEPSRFNGAERAMLRTAAPWPGLRMLSKQFASADEAAPALVRLYETPGQRRIADLSEYPWDAEVPDAGRLQFAWLPDMQMETWCSLMGRAALWSARRVEAEGPAAAWRFRQHGTLAVTNAPVDAKVRVRIWDADGRLRHEANDCFVPRLPGGRYFAGLDWSTDDGLADWTFITFEVAAPVSIEAIELESKHLRAGEALRADVRLSKTPPQGATIRFEVIDNYGRCVFTRDASAELSQEFEAIPGESLHIYNYANATLLDALGKPLHEMRQAFFIALPPLPTDDLQLMLWEGGANFDPRIRGQIRRFESLGIDAALQGTNVESSLACATCNIRPVVYATRMHASGVSEEGVRSPCITSESHLESLRKQMRGHAEQLKPYAPLAYSLGDDQHYLRSGQDACWSETCRAAFSVWAEKRYGGDLNALNKAWATSYASFAEVAPIRSKEAMDAVGEDYGPLCRWVDHKIFQDDLVVEWHKDLSGALSADPNAAAWYDCTIEGWMRPGSAFDFWKLASNTRFCVQYLNPIVHDLFQSAVAKDAYHGTWYGGYGIYNVYPYYDADYLPWWSVFRGINLHGLYYGGTGPGYYDERIIGADYGLMPVPERKMENLNELRGGIAKLLFAAHKETDDIAIVFSRPSNHLTGMFQEDLPRAPEWEGQYTDSHDFIYMQNWEGLAILLRDLGFSYKVVTPDTLTGRGLAEADIKTLVLPFALTLTQAQADGIRAWVNRGGNVIADAFPGRLDGSARPAAPGMLADVFGASFSDPLPKPDLVHEAASIGGNAPFARIVADAGAELTGAKALGRSESGTPILLFNAYGKGRALLLNFLARDYQIWRTQGTEMPFRDAVAGILEGETGLKPAVTCEVVCASEGKKAHRIQACELHRYEWGNPEFTTTYIAFLRQPKLRPDDMVYMADNRPKPCWIQFPEKAHVYDMRRGVYRGFTDRFDDVLYPGRAELFALMPYEVHGIDLSHGTEPGAVTLVGGVITGPAIVTGDKSENAAPHVFHIEVADPAGRPRPEFARNVLSADGTFNERFFLGYSAAPGEWWFRVKDVATGTTRCRAVKM